MSEYAIVDRKMVRKELGRHEDNTRASNYGMGWHGKEGEENME